MFKRSVPTQTRYLHADENLKHQEFGVKIVEFIYRF